jgi:hypothetical protein
MGLDELSEPDGRSTCNVDHSLEALFPPCCCEQTGCLRYSGGVVPDNYLGPQPPKGLRSFVLPAHSARTR